jgi:hypothetical protein
MTNGVMTSVQEMPTTTDTSWFAYHTARPAALNARPTVAFTTAESQLEITLSGSDADWVLPTLQAIAGLCRLDSNWDTYEALPIQTDQLQSALVFMQYFSSLDIPNPVVVPTNDGGIQFEWDLPSAEIEIRTMPGRNMSCFIEGRNRQHSTEAIPLNNPSRLFSLAKLLSQRPG